MAGAKLPGKVSLVSLKSISPAIDGSEATIGLLSLFYADNAGVNASNVKAAINNENFLTVNMIVGQFGILLFAAAWRLLQMSATSWCRGVPTTTFAVQLATRRVSFDVCIS